jgi:hypothetical protein
MKYLITESKIESTIESFLRSSFSEVVDVKFKRVGVVLGSETPSRRIERTNIEILIDPEGILNGNFNPKKGHFVGDNLKIEIWQTINSMFSLNMEKYGSEWDIEFLVLSIY